MTRILLDETVVALDGGLALVERWEADAGGVVDRVAVRFAKVDDAVLADLIAEA